MYSILCELAGCCGSNVKVRKSRCRWVV